MLTQLHIRKLFDIFDYDVEIPRNGEISIITGPNGYGKTTIFRIIDAISRTNLLYFIDLPFDKIIAEMDDLFLSIESEKSTDIIHADQDEEVVPHRSLTFRFLQREGGDEIGSFIVSDELIRSASRDYYASKFRRKRGGEEVENENDNNVEILKIIVGRQNKASLLTLLQSVKSKARLIPSQRLYDLQGEDLKEEIENISEGLRNKLESAYFEYLVNSQRIDSNFIDALMNSNIEIDEPAYVEEVKEINSQIEELKKFGLSPWISFPGYKGSKSSILKCFVDETKRKLKSYDGIRNQLNVFISLLENKQFANKRVLVNRLEGLRIYSPVSKSSIPLDRLSSGEKNEIIMLYDFIFEVNEGEILMIDEPEISLHVAWQNLFISEIEEIAKVKGIKIMVATHSPQIIGSEWDKCYDLFDVTEAEAEADNVDDNLS